MRHIGPRWQHIAIMKRKIVNARVLKTGVRQLGMVKASTRKIGIGKICAAQVGAVEFRGLQLATGKIRRHSDDGARAQSR